MQEVLEAIERHLGRKLPISKLDYYQVIGLELYCNDAQRIRKALQDATNRWMQSETGKYPESAQIIAKLLKQAQAILLDPEKQERYNLQLQKLRSSPTPDSTTSVEDRGSSNRKGGVENEDDRQSFPNADPMIPFSFEATGAQSLSSGNACAVLARMQDPQARLAELEQLFPALAEYENQPQQENNYDRHDPPSFLPKRETASRGLSLAQQIARRRKRNRIIASMLFFFGSQAILGLAIWAYLNNQGGLASKNKGLAKGQWQENMADAPKLPGIPSGEKKEEEVFPREQSPTQAEKDSRNASMQEQSQQKPPNQSRQPTTGNPDAMMPPAPMPDPAPMPTAKPEPEKPAASMESNAPTAEGEEWKKRMANARKALDKADFETFEKAIVTGAETAQTPAGREQAARLDQLGQLYKIGSESFEEARSKLKGTSSLRMGPSEISIVETTSEKLVIRVSGKNQTHPWDKLPAGIAIAMLDLTLDSDAPTDVAARAVFFSLAPQFREAATKNDSLKKRIAGWFEKSLGKDTIRVDLPQALTDSFE